MGRKAGRFCSSSKLLKDKHFYPLHLRRETIPKRARASWEERVSRAHGGELCSRMSRARQGESCSFASTTKHDRGRKSYLDFGEAIP
jgi:hypothetical protein